MNVLRKDRYNKKLKKYYVVYEENDTELSEDEERHERKDAEAPYIPIVHPPILVQLLFIHHPRWLQVDPDDVEFRRLGQPKFESESDEDGDSDKESKAVQVNTAAKDRLWMKQFDIYE